MEASVEAGLEAPGAGERRPSGRLPSGRHRLTREAVAESQRGRLLFAMAAAVAAKGYAAATVTDVVERASVSRGTFYEQFADKEACFLAALDTGVEVLLGRLAAAADALPEGAGWRARLRSDLRTYLELLAAEPAFAWTIHVETLAAGREALARRARIFAGFSARTRALNALARREDPALPHLPEEVFGFHSAGIDELVRETLRTRGARALPGLEEPALRATLALFGARDG